MPDQPYKFETFVRAAFAFASNVEILERAGDPAQLAEAGLFTDDNIDKIKSAASYSSVILTTAVMNELDSDIEDSEYVRINGYCSKIINAQSVLEIDELITDIQSSVVDRYFSREDGKLILKPYS
jgi:hypothetical protein